MCGWASGKSSSRWYHPLLISASSRSFPCVRFDSHYLLNRDLFFVSRVKPAIAILEALPPETLIPAYHCCARSPTSVGRFYGYRRRDRLKGRGAAATKSSLAFIRLSLC